MAAAMTPLRDVDHNVPPPSSQQQQQLQSSGSVTFLGYDSDTPLMWQKQFTSAKAPKLTARDSNVGDSPGKRWRMRQEAPLTGTAASASGSRPKPRPHFSNIIDLASDSEDDMAATFERRARGVTKTKAAACEARQSSSSDDDDDDDAEVHEKQAKNFANRLGIFAASTSAVTLPTKGSETTAASKDTSKVAKGSTSTKRGRFRGDTPKRDNDAVEVAPPDLSEGALPAIASDITPILRSIERCPICYQADFANLAKPKRKIKKPKKHKPETKKAVSAPGPARLLHLRQCMVVSDILDLDVVLGLVTDEQDRADKMRRQAHADALQGQSLWKTMTGESPPITQSSMASMRSRRGRYAYGKDTAKTGKKSPSPTKQTVQKRILGGSRGGLRLATCLVEKPVPRNGRIKAACVHFFGPIPRHRKETREEQSPRSKILSLYDSDVAKEMVRLKPKANGARYGLGVGACAPDPDDDVRVALASVSRLSMGRQLGFTVAKRFGWNESMMHDASYMDDTTSGDLYG